MDPRPEKQLDQPVNQPTAQEERPIQENNANPSLLQLNDDLKALIEGGLLKFELGENAANSDRIGIGSRLNLEENIRKINQENRQKALLNNSLVAIKEFLYKAGSQQFKKKIRKHKENFDQFYRDFYNTDLYRFDEEEVDVIKDILSELNVSQAAQAQLLDPKRARKMTLHALFAERHKNLYKSSQHCQINRILDELERVDAKRWLKRIAVGVIALAVFLGLAIWIFSLPSLIQFATGVYNWTITDIGRSVVSLTAAVGVSLWDIQSISSNYNLSATTCNDNLFLSIIQLILYTVPSIINIVAFGLSIPLLFGSLTVIASFMEGIKARNGYLDAKKNVALACDKYATYRTEEANLQRNIVVSYRALRDAKRFGMSALSNKKIMQVHLYAAMASIVISGLIAFAGIGMVGYAMTAALVLAKMVVVKAITDKAERLLDEEISEDYEYFENRDWEAKRGSLTPMGEDFCMLGQYFKLSSDKKVPQKSSAAGSDALEPDPEDRVWPMSPSPAGTSSSHASGLGQLSLHNDSLPESPLQPADSVSSVRRSKESRKEFTNSNASKGSSQYSENGFFGWDPKPLLKKSETKSDIPDNSALSSQQPLHDKMAETLKEEVLQKMRRYNKLAEDQWGGKIMREARLRQSSVPLFKPMRVERTTQSFVYSSVHDLPEFIENQLLTEKESFNNGESINNSEENMSSGGGMEQRPLSSHTSFG